LPRNALAWGMLALLLSLQAWQFFDFARREVIWAYPANHDQLAYLDLSYRTYEAMKSRGSAWGMGEGLGFSQERVPLAAQGAVLHVQAAMMYRFVGPARLAAISLNLAYWLLFEAVFVATVRRATGRWDLAFLGLGLLIGTKSRFNFAGDLFDFRLDFAAACLFGIFICAVVRSRLRQRRWCAVAGLLGGCVIAVRFITAVYFAGVLGLVGVGDCLDQRERARAPCNKYAEVARGPGHGAGALGAGCAGVVPALGVDPVLLLRMACGAGQVHSGRGNGEWELAGRGRVLPAIADGGSSREDVSDNRRGMRGSGGRRSCMARETRAATSSRLFHCTICCLIRSVAAGRADGGCG
jgi:hypothetical protein